MPEQVALKHGRTAGVSGGGGSAGMWRRVAILAGGVATFALVASLIRPGESSAQMEDHPAANLRSFDRSTDDPAAVVRSLVRLRHPQGWPLIGALAGMDYIVLVHGADEGARYSVYTSSGKLMRADLMADEVYREFPSLDLPGAHLQPGEQGEIGEPIMMILPEQE